MAALRVRDIDLGRSRIRVERSASKVNSKTIIGTTKTHQARSVPVAASVLKLWHRRWSAKPLMSCCGLGPMGNRCDHQPQRIGSAQRLSAARRPMKSSLG
jgi:hypothetical protein